MSQNSQGFLAFIATLIRRRLDEETPPLPTLPTIEPSRALPGVGRARHALEESGTSGYSQWLGGATRLLLADTTVDRLQSGMLGSPIRTAELCEHVSEAVRLLPELTILEVTSPDAIGDALGQARECPFRRIEELRRAAPGLVLRASVSAVSCVGVLNAPRSAFAVATDELVDAGIDIVRISDPYNDVQRLDAAIAAATLSDAVVEGTICVSGTLEPTSARLVVERVVATAQALEKSGVHTIVLEDRSGMMRPVGAYTMVRALRREVTTPIWVRVADVCGYGLATLVAAVEAGAVGVDAITPSLTGLGLEPSALAVVNALSDTERKPEVEALPLTAVDERVERLVKLLGGWHPCRRVPPDAADRGLTPQVISDVLAHCAADGQVSLDHAFAACDAARTALGHPAMVVPASRALTDLAVQMVLEGEPAGSLIDRARADDPEGVLDSMGTLREGGFPEDSIEAQAPRDRDELLEMAWGDLARKFREHQARFGHLELLPSEPLRFGLGVGERLTCLVNSDPQVVRVLSINTDADTATITLNDHQLELRLRAHTADP